MGDSENEDAVDRLGAAGGQLSLPLGGIGSAGVTGDTGTKPKPPQGPSLKSSLASLYRKMKDCVGEIQIIHDQGKRAVTESPTAPEVSLFKGMAKTLEAYHSKFEQYWNEAADISDSASIEFPSRADKDLNGTMRHHYYNALGNLEIITSRRDPNVAFLQPIPTANSLLLNESRISKSLPKLQLPTFSGQLLDWPKFRDIYSSLVHKEVNYSDMDKFLYLRTALKGPALSTISHLPLEENNYRLAWQALLETYDHHRLLASAYLDQVLAFKPIQGRATPESLKNFLTTVSDSVSSFKLLKVDKELEFVLFHLAVKGLDPYTRELFEIEHKNVRFPSFDALTKFVRDRVIALQLSSTNNPAAQPLTTSATTKQTSKDAKPPKPKNSSKTSLLTNDKSSTERKSQSERKGSSSSCFVCKSLAHSLLSCEVFNRAPVHERYEFLKGWKGCVNCMAASHTVQQCPSKWHCRFCPQRHHSSLHKFDANTAQLAAPDVSQEPTSFCGQTFTAADEEPAVVLGTAITEIQDARGYFQKIRLVIDSGSQNSFITHSCVNRLGLSMSKVRRSISGIGQTPFQGAKGTVTCTLRARTEQPTTNPNLKTHAIVVNKISSYLPTSVLPLALRNVCSKFELADPTFWKPGQIDFLLGADLFMDIWTGAVTTIEGFQAKLISSIFGHVVIGKVQESNSTSSVTTLLSLSPQDDLSLQLQKFWEIENPLPNRHDTNPEDDECEDHFFRTHYRLADGRYVVRLPVKGDQNWVGDTSSLAIRRFYNIERKLTQKTVIREKYVDFMKEYQALGHMIPTESSSRFIIPHHCVVKEVPDGISLRVVFDASAKGCSSSLNDHLLVGPKLQKEIREILLNFRRHQVVFTTDIVKMFRQIAVAPEDRSFQHIYWRDSPADKVQKFELNTVTYGLACAPFLANRVIQQLVDDHGKVFPLAARALAEDIYVDDVLTGAQSLAEAIECQHQLIGLLKMGCFELSKWASNEPSLLQYVSGKSSTDVVSFNDSENPCIKVLGLQWDPTSDEFLFSIKTPQPVYTKRGVLSSVARLYDPLGFLTPCTLHMKGFIQELWKRSVDWDEDIPSDVRESWQEILEQLPLLSKLRIPRFLRATNNCKSRCQVLGFADASMKGYAAVLYLRVEIQGSCEIYFLTAKSKLAPLKAVTIPRLELSAALLLAQLYSSVAKLLDSYKDRLEPPIFFSDSAIVLSWLNTPSYKLKVFVANRVEKVIQLTSPSTWRHVESKDNPSDPASRGLLPSQLLTNSLWWSGPHWLPMNIQEWPSSSLVPLAELPEMKKDSTTLIIAGTENPLVRWMLRFSSYLCLIRSVAWLRRWLYNLKHVGCCCCRMRTGRLQKFEYDEAVVFCIKSIQFHHFLQGSSIKKVEEGFANLRPYLDSDGIIRVGGRLHHSTLLANEKHPILLPYKSHFTTIMLDYFHQIYLHPGPSTLQAIIQRKFWIPGIRRLISTRGFHCLKCYKSRAKPVVPLMGDLPSFRVNGGQPFAHVGVDFAGPFYIKEHSRRNPVTSKAYLCLWVCMATKALHLEAVTRLTTDAFLAALERFIARRGLPSDIYSDNGSNFLGAAKYLKEIFEWLNQPETKSRLTDHAMVHNINWHFNPPLTPHMGGIWEAGVKSVKTRLRLIVGEQKLTFEETTTLFAKIEAQLNSRPLCPLSSDPNEADYLSPGHFLVGRPLQAMPEPSLLDVKENRLSRWQLIAKMNQQFWVRWRHEYLQTLQKRPKWYKTAANLEPGDLVLLKQDVSPLQWPMAKVLEVHTGADGAVRVATVQTKKAIYKRSVINLVPLLPLQSCPYPNGDAEIH